MHIKSTFITHCLFVILTKRYHQGLDLPPLPRLMGKGIDGMKARMGEVRIRGSLWMRMITKKIRLINRYIYVYQCIYVYIYTYIWTCTSIYICEYVCSNIHTCIYIMNTYPYMKKIRLINRDLNMHTNIYHFQSQIYSC
jgi:hypothetical protein